MFHSIKSLALACAVTGLVSGAAQSAQLTFFGEDTGLGEGSRLAAFPNASAAQAAFLANLIGVGTETFESFAAGATAPLPIIFPGAGTATLIGAGNIEAVGPGVTNGVGRFPISGVNFFNTTSDLRIEFDSPVAAFGFYGVDVGDFNGQITLEFESGVSTLLNIGNGVGVPGGGVLYFGFIDTVNPFTAVSFGNTAAGTDVFAFDDFTIGSVEQVKPVPVPMSLALFGMGLAGLGLVARRRAA